MKNKRVAHLTDFKIGTPVVLHFRKSRTDGALLVTELDDPASWTWLSEVRKNTTAAVLTEITEDTLSVTIGAEKIPLDYTVSEKTRWEKSGKEVAPDAFKVGDRVYVVPRALPGGSVMARAVADTTSGAAQEKERLAASLHGVIVTMDAPAHKLTLKTAAGDTRSLAYNEDTELLRNGKPLALSALKSGLHIGARLRHEAGDEEVTWRITIETGRKSGTRKRTPNPEARANDLLDAPATNTKKAMDK